jgi:sugar lactone lactonase YvrE
MRRTAVLALLPVLIAGPLALSVAANPSPAFPETVALPSGWLPEGVVASGTTIYAGSRANGAIYQADVRTGTGSVLVDGVAGRVAVGLEVDAGGRRLFVAGGGTGRAFVYDTASGAELAAYSFATAPTFVNDVAVSRDAAWFTDSQRPVLYRVPLGPGGVPGDPADVEIVPLSGDWQQVPGFNANGIDVTPDGHTLLVVNSTSGLLYRVDAATGAATVVDLGGASLSAGDGLLLRGFTLYVVRNRLNQIVEVQLDPDLASGEVVSTLTDPDFDVPTTVTFAAGSLYAVNARFTTPPTPTTEYDVVKVG